MTLQELSTKLYKLADEAYTQALVSSDDYTEREAYGRAEGLTQAWHMVDTELEKQSAYMAQF